MPTIPTSARRWGRQQVVGKWHKGAEKAERGKDENRSERTLARSTAETDKRGEHRNSCAEQRGGGLGGKAVGNLDRKLTVCKGEESATSQRSGKRQKRRTAAHVVGVTTLSDGAVLPDTLHNSSMSEKGKKQEKRLKRKGEN
jgi:hypothetical protein